MNSGDPSEYKLDQFLDGTMSPKEAAQFKDGCDARTLQESTELQSEIDESLGRLLSGFELNEQEIIDQFVESKSTIVTNAKPETGGMARRTWIQIAVAASLVLASSLGIWNFWTPRQVAVGFTPAPLAGIYVDSVSRGFSPYYNCEDDTRFANTFSRKLGQPMALMDMPANCKMLGISTLGGISRNTIAMLCVVDQQNVLVFVDRDGEPGIATAIANESDLNVFVERKNGLIFCEVTPHDSAKMIEFFEFIDN